MCLPFIARGVTMNYDITTYRIVRQKKGDHQYIEKHSHKSYFHDIYILNGKGRVIVDGYDLSVEKYDLVMVPPGIEHEIYGIQGLITLDLKFSCKGELLERLMECGYLIRHISAYENQLIQNIFDEAVNRPPMYEAVIDAKLLELLYQVVRRERRGIEMILVQRDSKGFFPSPQNKALAQMQPVVNYIQENLEHNFQIAALAERFGYSESYFSTMFKRYTGYAPSKYINILKIERAKELILYTPNSLTQIAEELGFDSIHYFSRVFKQVTGVSPTSYMDRTKVDMVINVLKDTDIVPPEDQYEIQIREIE